MFRQAALLRLALAERGMTGPEYRVRCTKDDHWLGRAFYGDTEVGIIYPDSFFEQTRTLYDTPKVISLHFEGHCNRGRRAMLMPLRDYPDAYVHESRRGRTVVAHSWDPQYYEGLAHARFGLCPHHPEWPGPWDSLWTYRFIDSVLVGAIPVNFRSTPLAAAFIDGFRWVWDDGVFKYSREDAAHNRALAEERFRL